MGIILLLGLLSTIDKNYTEPKLDEPKIEESTAIVETYKEKSIDYLHESAQKGIAYFEQYFNLGKEYVEDKIEETKEQEKGQELKEKAKQATDKIVEKASNIYAKIFPNQKTDNE